MTPKIIESEVATELRPVAGYEGYYSVANDGRIWSHPRRQKYSGRVRGGHFIKGGKSKNGYWAAIFCKDGPRQNLLIHRVVAFAWLEPPANSSMEVNHKDGNKDNNHPSNLEWCTPAENIRHAISKGLIVHTQAMRDALRVTQINTGIKKRALTDAQVDYLFSELFNGRTQKSLAKEFGLHVMTINNIVHGKTYRNKPACYR